MCGSNSCPHATPHATAHAPHTNPPHAVSDAISHEESYPQEEEPHTCDCWCGGGGGGSEGDSPRVRLIGAGAREGLDSADLEGGGSGHGALESLALAAARGRAAKEAADREARKTAEQRKRSRKQQEQLKELLGPGGCFSFEALSVATRNWHDSMVLGNGMSGNVYLAYVPSKETLDPSTALTTQSDTTQMTQEAAIKIIDPEGSVTDSVFGSRAIESALGSSDSGQLQNSSSSRGAGGGVGLSSGAFSASDNTSLKFEQMFFTEVSNLQHYRHKNLVQLLGASVDGPWYAIVYELMPGGSVYDRLKEGRSGKKKASSGQGSGEGRSRSNSGAAASMTGGVLGWQQRLSIAVGGARGLEHLHHGTPPTIHRDVKSMNILLDADGVAKISDFGTVRAEAKLTAAKTHVTTMNIVGTVCYMAPEYFRAGQITQKIDSYAFGVVLLELITGQPPVDLDGTRNQQDIVTSLEDVMYDIFEAKEEQLYHENKADEGEDEANDDEQGGRPSPMLQTSVSDRSSWKKLEPFLDPHTDWPLEKAVELLRIARMCLQPRRASRWSVREALPHLEALAEIRALARAQPGSKYDPDTGELRLNTQMG
eukprot:g2142.t1